MKCPSCQSEVSEDSRFCSKCGSAVHLAAEGEVSFTKTLTTPRPAIASGSLLAGKYRIQDEIGRGGMGIVYRAEDIKLSRPVALKFLPPELIRDMNARERFVRTLTGKDVDLTKLPFHPQHAFDGSCYMSSAVDYVIDPATHCVLHSAPGRADRNGCTRRTSILARSR